MWRLGAVDFRQVQAQPPEMNRADRDGRRASLGCFLLLVSIGAGCGGRSGRAEDVFVDDPTTLAAVRALHAPPEVVVTVERVTQPERYEPANMGTHSSAGSGRSAMAFASRAVRPSPRRSAAAAR
jgi:hypothetical protein